MPSYAILGTTGNTGQSLLNILSQSPDKEIHAFVRSKAKLLRLNPDIAGNQKVKIYEGELYNTSLISDCMTGTRAVFLVVAVSDNLPGCTIAQDTSRLVFAAVENMRAKDPHAKLPRLIVLSSASLDPHLCRHMPSFVQWLLHTSSSNVYADLAKAEEFLRSKQDWIVTTFIKPGGLVHDEQRGHELSFDKEKTFVSFLDLAAGMVEVADAEGDMYNWRSVSVLPTSDQVKFEWMVPVYLLKGMICHYFPWAYPYMKS